MSRLLVIPDVHQDLMFLSRILDRENFDTYDQIILLGDFFDARSEAFNGEQATKLTAQFLLELVESYPRKVRLCWGNHDLIYCRLREYVQRVGTAGIDQNIKDSDLKETFERALWINEIWPGEMWFRLELAVRHGDWLFSHAGIHPDFWPRTGTPDAALEDLLMDWEGIIGDLFENEDHPLLEAGPARGGSQPVGGPLWLDWESEFMDQLPFRQVVGHSAANEARQKGKSWCIDCGQAAYAVIAEEELEVRRFG